MEKKINNNPDKHCSYEKFIPFFHLILCGCHLQLHKRKRIDK